MEKPTSQATLSTRREQAAYNNAIWCDMVCRAHGIPGTFQSQIWLNPQPVPPYYPNAVTLSGQAGIAEQLTAIHDLINGGALTDLAVKDSFALLDLAPLGFASLFEATWFWREPTASKPNVLTEGIHWTAVQQPDELAQWEIAWSALPANQQLTVEARIFMPSLLTDQDIVFIAAYRNQQIVGGAVGNRTGNVVGLSNQFAPSGEAATCWAGYIAELMTAFPGRAIVGYEYGETINLVRSLGFDEVGPLRVWIRAGTASSAE